MFRVASPTMIRRAVRLLFAALLVSAAVPVIAWAHSGPSAMIGPERPASPPPASADSMAKLAGTSDQPAPAHTLVLLVAAIVLVGPLMSRRRRVWRLALVGISLLLVQVGFEGAVHSVHHLGDSQGADRCRVASSADHVSAVDLDVPRAVGSAPLVPDAMVPAPPEIARAVSLAPAASRAPPA
jgi:hypothetical protein